jgi:hypothetical protein
MNTELLQQLAARFWQELQTSSDLQSHVNDHRVRSQRAQAMLTIENIPKLMEQDFRELFFDSDAFGFWGNKEWYFNHRLQSIGLDGLRSVMFELIDRGERGMTPEDLKSIWLMRGLGTLLSTELLAYRFPTRYWTYNESVTLKALQILGEDIKEKMPRGQKSDHYLYFTIQPLLDQVCRTLNTAGISEVDYLTADIFLWWVKTLQDVTIEFGPGAKVIQSKGSNPPPKPPKPQVSIDVMQILADGLASEGLYFTPWQVATFYTALQTKGFVILSGISGTGKTKLVQAFANMLPQLVGKAITTDVGIQITVQPYMKKYNRFIIPKAAARFFDPPASGQAKDIRLTFDNGMETCRLTHSTYPGTDYIQVLLKGKASAWFTNNFTEGDTLFLEPELDTEGSLVGFRLANPKTTSIQSIQETKKPNWLFVPVRPDWRDSKSLLGYFNPLTGTYQWTPFLRFLVQAEQSYRFGEQIAWFVILDEMNLARVEYYFADLLSVLESGRDEHGWTREPLRPEFPENEGEDLPPRDLHIPPNLYIVGTVNVDESTYAFSPKVLDRAFTLELTEADFANYPPDPEIISLELTEDHRKAILHDFSLDGVFAHIDKRTISAYVANHPEIRTRLQTLNSSLKPYELHFGYRVFDEIVAFLYSAECNQLYSPQNFQEIALDTAVLMKVLPKFHGSRGKLEPALLTVLAWCMDPDVLNDQAVTDALDQVEGGNDLKETLSQMSYIYPKTAEKVRRMLWALHTTGFASFG